MLVIGFNSDYFSAEPKMSIGTPGSVSQLERCCLSQLTKGSKTAGIAMDLMGSITKDKLQRVS